LTRCFDAECSTIADHFPHADAHVPYANASALIAIAARPDVANKFISCAREAVRLKLIRGRSLNEKRKCRCECIERRLVVRAFLLAVCDAERALNREVAGDVSCTGDRPTNC
jgi:hypothetical protein